jgi:hypothetical protein
MTVDHTWEHPELNNVLSRAIGLDPRVLMDFSDGDLAVNDRFLLISDGIWGVLPDALDGRGLARSSRTTSRRRRAEPVWHWPTAAMTTPRPSSSTYSPCPPPACATVLKAKPACPCRTA